MGCFKVRYDHRVVIYDRSAFIKLTTDKANFVKLAEFCFY